MPHDPLAELLTAAGGLLYPSESDAPFDPIRCTASPTLGAAVATLAQGRPIHETTLTDFFAELESSTGDDAPRWHALRQSLERHLHPPRVFRIGRRRLDIYILGQPHPSPSNEWIGLHTTSVET